MKDKLRSVVEAATDRSVIAYMSSIHVNPDLAVELFVLEPVEEPVPVESPVASAEEPAA
jgi:hypothetical protein